MNIRCSNRCAKPVRPGDSSFDPTWYHTSTATRGLERSTWKITGSPFSRTNVSNGIVSIGGTKEPASWHESVPARRLKVRNPSILPAPGAAGMLALLVALPIALGPTQARANGALPASYGILLPADKPQEVVLATNFGMIISEDAGKSWLWTCERPETSFGYLYGVGPPPRDRFYALSPDTGLAVSDDGSCTWQRSGGALSSLVASDFFVDRTNADRVVAIAAPVDSDDRRHRAARGVPVDGRRHDLRRDAALHRARGREHRQPGDRAQQSDGDLPGDVHDARSPSPSRPFGRRRSDLGGARRRGEPRRQRIPHPHRRPGRRERPLSARDRAGHGERRGDARRGHDLRDARDDHEGDAERVRAARERDGPGRRRCSARTAAA